MKILTYRTKKNSKLQGTYIKKKVHPTKNYLTQNVNSANAEKLYSK